MPFTKEDMDALVRQLHELADGPDYIAFQQKLIPGARQIIGVRTPRLRALSKDILKGDFRGFLFLAQNRCFELDMLSAFVIASCKCDLPERLELINAFAPTINNWAVCDALGMGLKCARTNRDTFWDFLGSYFASDRPFTIRLAVVILLGHFVSDDYIDRVLDVLISVSHHDYYLKMGVAWALAECCTHYTEKTLPIFEQGLIPDKFTHNKAIQKSIESFRVTDEVKAHLRTLRRK